MSRRRTVSRLLRDAAVVFAKEWRDALRDRRTLATLVLSTVAMGPLLLLLVSTLVADAERRAQARELMVQGAEHAPTLVNHLQRQGVTLRPAPPDAAERLSRGRLGQPLLVVAPGFEDALAAGRPPVLELWSHAGDARAQPATARAQRLLESFNQEQALLRLALRGVAPGLLQVVTVQPREAAPAAARDTPWSAVLPTFVLMALLYGALHVALDSTAGERERGSLEPLLATPAARVSLVLGKWGAVVALAVAASALAAAGFLAGPWLLRSATLAALFRYGPLEAAAFVALLLPLAMAMAALLMALAVRCTSVKQAQAGAGVVLLGASLLPLLVALGPAGDPPWQRWVPALAQTRQMVLLLQGQPPDAAALLPGVAVCLALTGLALASVVRALRGGALH